MLGCPVSEVLAGLCPTGGCVSGAWAGGLVSVMGGGAVSVGCTGSGVITASRAGIFFFLAFVLRFTVLLAFFFAPFFALRITGKQ